MRMYGMWAVVALAAAGGFVGGFFVRGEPVKADSDSPEVALESMVGKKVNLWVQESESSTSMPSGKLLSVANDGLWLEMQTAKYWYPIRLISSISVPDKQDG